MPLIPSTSTTMSPAFTGDPTAPTATAGDDDTSVATTAFVTAAVAPKAPTASPTFTGTPTAPTATGGTDTTQIATTEFVTQEIATQAAADSGTYAPLSVAAQTAKFSDLVGVTGKTSAHRLGWSVYPESSLYALSACLSGGIGIFDCDCAVTQDGIPIAMHDLTLDRTTTLTGNVADTPYAVVTTGTIDHAPWGTTLYTSAAPIIPTLGQLAGALAGRAILTTEPKVYSDIPKVAAVIKALHLEQSVAITASSTAWIPNILAQGCLAVGSGGSQTAAQIAEYGVVAWSVPIDTDTDSRLALLTDLRDNYPNIIRICHFPTRRHITNAARAAGAQIVNTDDPLYIDATAPIQTAIDFTKQAPGHGWNATTTTGIAFDGTSGMKITPGGVAKSICFGDLGPFADTTKTVTMVYQIATLPTDTTKGLQVRVGPSDKAFTPGQSYADASFAATFRSNGRVQLYKNAAAAGDVSQAQSATGSLTTGVDYTVTMQISPTTVTGTHTAGLTANFARQAGDAVGPWYLHLGCSTADTDGVYSVKSITIS